MKPIVRAFGQAVRSQREARGWSQEGLAEHADLNRSFVGEVERGSVIPSIVTIEKLAGGLGLEMAKLIHDTESLVQQEAKRNASSLIRLASIAC
jgi:ribosome-binding protein aMBF1 (putative translation factor)